MQKDTWAIIGSILASTVGFATVVVVMMNSTVNTLIQSHASFQESMSSQNSLLESTINERFRSLDLHMGSRLATINDRLTGIENSLRDKPHEGPSNPGIALPFVGGQQCVLDSSGQVHCFPVPPLIQQNVGEEVE